MILQTYWSSSESGRSPFQISLHVEGETDRDGNVENYRADLGEEFEAQESKRSLGRNLI